MTDDQFSQKHDALCMLPINVVNEKIYVFLWFWLLLLVIIRNMKTSATKH